MKIQILVIATAAVILAACGKREPPAGPAAPQEQQPKKDQQSANAPADDSTKPDYWKPDYWMNVKYKIDREAEEHDKVHHVSLGGTIEIVEIEGEYRVRTEDGDTVWRDEYQDVVLTFNEKGERYCAPIEDFNALTEKERTGVAAFIKGDEARRFLAKAPVKLHDEDKHAKKPKPHEKHVIDICPVDPEFTKDEDGKQKKEILIMTYYEGGGHDGISHGSD